MLVIKAEYSRGVVMCVGDKGVGDAISSIEPLRTVFHITMPVTVAHCDEISQENLNLLYSHNITTLDICPRSESTIFGMPIEKARKRLRSWWCKPAAVVMVPYDEVMLVDVDAIFFKNPETLFNTKGMPTTNHSKNLIVFNSYFLLYRL